MFLLDTNVLSEVSKRSPDPRVHRWLDSVPGPALYVSSLAIGELRQGVERLRARDPRQAEVFERGLLRMRSEFTERIIPVDLTAAEAWGRLNAIRPLPVIDGLMAGTALSRNWILATRNTKDFHGLPVGLVNPFEEV